jgi:hypothetical protein
MATEMHQGDMLEDFSFALHRMTYDSTGEQRKALQGIYDAYPGENGDTIIVIRPEMRTLLFSKKTREHMNDIIRLIQEGITGTEAIKAVLAGEEQTTMISGTL